MKKTRYTTEQIIMNLRKIEVMVGQGRTVQESCRETGINEQTYYRWRNKYGGMSTSGAKKLKALEKENERLNVSNGAILTPFQRLKTDPLT